MATRITICPGDQKLSEAVTTRRQSPQEGLDATAIAERIAAAISAGKAHVEPDFIFGSTLEHARSAAEAMIRSRRTDCPAELMPVLGAIDSLRMALIACTQRELLEQAELQLLFYKAGGSYRRHCDDGPGISIGMNGRSVRRSLSILVYLTSDAWNSDVDGGSLRVFAPKGYQGPPVDIPPLPGTLVVFDSASIPRMPPGPPVPACEALA